MLDIVFYTEGLPFDGQTPFERSLGGSESAVVFLARELARRGHKVRVFCPCERPGRYEGVDYEDLTEWPEFAELRTCDVFVCTRHLRGLTAPVRSRVNVVWNHDLLPKEAASQMMSLMYKTDRLFVLSEFHKSAFQRHLSVPEERYVVTRNGVDLALVDEALEGVERDPDRVLYTSRPERGLDVLLTLWPEVKRRRPNLKLGVAFYENPGPDAHMAEYLRTLRSVAEALPDVTLLGGLTKRELYRELAGSALVLYPATFPEVSCISAMEAAACGTPMVASRYGALKETIADGESGVLIAGDPRTEEYQRAYAEAVEALLSGAARGTGMGAAARRRVEERYQWRDVAAEWEREFEALMAGSTGKQQTVSACMIVRNAQGTLYRCLDSVKEIADEIIVCDTGSSDRTMKIAREYTDKLTSIPWNDDFAAARNRSIAEATGDWILWIDADEYLLGGEHLGKYLRDNMYQGYVIRQHHQAIDAQFKPDVPVRLFRNHRNIKFFGCIHEHPETELNAGIAPSVILSDVHIMHDGYVTETIRRKRFLRNLPLLLKDRKRNPQRRLGLVFLERDYVHLARYELERTRGMMTEKASGYLERALEIHREHFASPEDPLHGYSLPLYQSALELLGEGFELGYFLQISDGSGGRLPPSEIQRRRVADEAEAREFLEWHFEQLVKEARGEEEFGFDE